MNLDQWVVFYMNQVGGLAPWIDPVIVFFAEYFPYLVALLFVYIVWRQDVAFQDKARFILEAAVAVVLSRAVFVELIRYFYHRPRPFVNNHAIVSLLTETSYSFPSGHAAFFFALSTSVYLHNKRWGVWFIVASIVIGIARVMAGVHYPTDILGGAVLGIVVGFGVHTILKDRAPHLNPPL